MVKRGRYRRRSFKRGGLYIYSLKDSIIIAVLGRTAVCRGSYRIGGAVSQSCAQTGDLTKIEAVRRIRGRVGVCRN